MKKANVQNAVFGERKDFESSQTDSSYQTASKSIRGMNSDDVTFGVFKTSNKAMGIKAGQSCGPVDGPHWRQGMLSSSELDRWTDENPKPNLGLETSQKFWVPLPKVDGKGKEQNMAEHAENVEQFSAPATTANLYSKREAFLAKREEQVELALTNYHAKPKNVATGSEVLNSSGTTRRIREAQVRASGFGEDLSGELAAEQQRRMLENMRRASKPEKKLVSVSTGKPVDTERDANDQRKRFSLNRANAKHNAHRNKYLRALKRTETPKPKGIKGLGVDQNEYKKAIAQVGEPAVAAQELRRFVPDHNRSWNKNGLRNPILTHKQKQV